MNRSIAVCTLLMNLCFILPVFASWTDELVDELETGVGALESTLDTGELSPYRLLPLSPGNQWQFHYYEENKKPGDVGEDITLSLGETERLGDFCLSPLVFGDNKQLELFISNTNERLVFYGFRGQISGEDVGFFFRNGTESSIDSGIDLASIDDNQALLLEQSGKQPSEVNGQTIQLTWIARNKAIQELDNAKSFDGEVAEQSDTVTPPSTAYEFRFDLYLKPCEVETGCFAGRFTLEFMPGLGLTRVTLQGDSPNLGGQYLNIYELVDSSAGASSYTLDSKSNELSFFSCNALFSEDKLSQAATGSMVFWFTIALLIVVVLRALYYRLDRPQAAKVDHHNDKNY